MKFTTPLNAKELKAELKAAGVKVLRCKQYQNNALVTIANEEGNAELFEAFARENNYAGICGMELVSKPTNANYIDYGNVFKYRTAEVA